MKLKTIATAALATASVLVAPASALAIPPAPEGCRYVTEQEAQQSRFLTWGQLICRADEHLQLPNLNGLNGGGTTGGITGGNQTELELEPAELELEPAELELEQRTPRRLQRRQVSPNQELRQPSSLQIRRGHGLSNIDELAN